MAVLVEAFVLARRNIAAVGNGAGSLKGRSIKIEMGQVSLHTSLLSLLSHVTASPSKYTFVFEAS